MDEEMIAMDLGFAAAYWNLGIIHTLHERFEKAIEELSQAVEYSGGMPSTLAMLAYAYIKSGDEARALELLAELEIGQDLPVRGYVSPVLIAHVHEGLGKPEDALNWLEKGFKERDGWLILLTAYPRFESLRGEPRFQDLLHNVWGCLPSTTSE